MWKYLVIDTLNILSLMAKRKGVLRKFNSKHKKLQEKLFCELWYKIKSYAEVSSNTTVSLYFCAKYHNTQQKEWWIKIAQTLFRQESDKVITHVLLGPSSVQCIQGGISSTRHYECGADDYAVLAIYNALRLSNKRNIKILSNDKFKDFEKIISHHFPLHFRGFVFLSSKQDENKASLQILTKQAQFNKPNKDVFLSIL